MEKAVKQRLLGGVVLVAGAALFLPMLLDGSGAPLTVPPMPAAPAVPAVEAVAPKLEEQVQAADQAVDAAHAAPADAGHDVGQDVAADAAAGAQPAKPVADAQAQARLEDEKVAAQAKATQARLAQEKAAQEKLAQAKAAQDKAAQDKAAQEKAAKEKAAKALADQKQAQKQAQASAAAKPAEAKPAAVALPEAWVVQVASLSAKEKADELAKKLRQKNYRAVVHQQGSVWKVVVGPELRKEVAESIKSRLASDPELKLSGWVQAYKP